MTLSPEKYREMLLELARRDAAEQVPDVLDGCFPQQHEFVVDESPFASLFCTRRSAKSFTAGTKMVYRALKYPGTNHLFTGLTRISAKGIIWKDVLRVINRKFGLNARFNETDLTMTLPNGSEIWATGIDATEEEMAKVLGRKFKTACIDEASMYTINLSDFVYGILGPAMADEDGVINLFGTASDFPRGLFFDITTGKEGGWKQFQWTALDNPYVRDNWVKRIEEIKANRPLYMETPQFKQWFLNLWEIDEKKLVYRFNPDRNLIKPRDFETLVTKLDPSGWSVVLGTDLGWEDDNAFVLTAYHVNDPNLYVLSHFCRKHMFFDDKDLRADYGVVQKIEQFMADRAWSPQKVIIDGANKQGVESMRQRSTIPFEYADKKDKATFIELCNSNLIEGKVKFLDRAENIALWQEMTALIWRSDPRDGDKIKHPKEEHPSLPNHRTDAFLYAWRNGYHYQSAPKETKVVVGSKAWYLQQSVDIWEREREKLVAEQEKTEADWPSMSDGW